MHSHLKTLNPPLGKLGGYSTAYQRAGARICASPVNCVEVSLQVEKDKRRAESCEGSRTTYRDKGDTGNKNLGLKRTFIGVSLTIKLRAVVGVSGVTSVKFS